MAQSSIEKVIGILKEEVKKYEMPIVTKVGDSRDPFKVLISCLLSLRTKDKTTAKASTSLFKVANTPEDILKLSVKRIEKLIYPVGFYRVKARRIKEISKVLINKYNGKVPDSMEELLKLPGIGKKCGALTLIYGFNKSNYIPIDVHVQVITNRLGWVKTKNPDKTMHGLMKIIPKKYWHDLNNLLVAYGQNICLTNSPFCSRCAISKYCPKIGVKRSR